MKPSLTSPLSRGSQMSVEWVGTDSQARGFYKGQLTQVLTLYLGAGGGICLCLLLLLCVVLKASQLLRLPGGENQPTSPTGFQPEPPPE